MKNVFYVILLVCIGALSACNANLDSLVSHEWKAVSMRLENGTVSTTDSLYSLDFENARQFRLQLDINTCGGELTFRGQSVRFQNGMMCTEACCDSEFATTLAANLTKAQKWELQNNTLIFTSEKGLRIEFVKK